MTHFGLYARRNPPGAVLTTLASPLWHAGQRGVPLAAGVPEARQNTLAERFAHGFAGDFAKNLPTSEFLGSFSDVAEAREDSAGFIVGKPDNFPLFSAIGGFGPMQDIEKGDSASSFVPAFSIPTMNIPDIPDQHPQFEFPQFAQQVSGIREASQPQPQPIRQPESGPQEPPAASFKPSQPQEDEDGFRLVFPESVPSQPPIPLPTRRPTPPHPPRPTPSPTRQQARLPASRTSQEASPRGRVKAPSGTSLTPSETS
ncbi:hypothetical protein C7M84_004382 [Penaeus vannamei]|uniref:Uncharacterized protein n=1 Tax=Penaeus vannamei TaxID=6689 RepID=A0A423TKM3_PENVA|nr:hypothetical protein C7M84_004382 [Penaeus vannamei]